MVKASKASGTAGAGASAGARATARATQAAEAARLATRDRFEAEQSARQGAAKAASQRTAEAQADLKEQIRVESEMTTRYNRYSKREKEIVGKAGLQRLYDQRRKVAEARAAVSRAQDAASIAHRRLSEPIIV